MFDSAATIEGMSYTEFVAFINQTNVPPGSITTVNQWIIFGKVDKDSTVYECASTTGFSCLEIAKKTGAKCVGVDISKPSVSQANKNTKRLGLQDCVSFHHGDAASFESDEDFTHVVMGAALQFFPSPELMLRHSFKLLRGKGILLASPFFAKESIPSSLIDLGREAFGINPTNVGYKEVMNLFEGLTIEYEQRFDIIQETDREISHYCDSTIVRLASERPDLDDETLDSCSRRLRKIKDASNALRPYQAFSTLVLDYDETVYPARYIELF